MNAVRRTTLLGLALAGMFAAPAQANLVAAVEVPNSVGNLDIAAFDTATGTRFDLPAGINTSADELHPGVSSTGKFLVFERRTSAGTVRIIMVDLANGQQADLFNGFEASSSKPATPAISFKGTRVITGRLITGNPSTSRVISVDVTSFPAGPFPKSDLKGSLGVQNAITRNPSITSGARVAWRTFDLDTFVFSLSYAPVGGTVVQSGTLIDHPAILPSDLDITVFETGGSVADLVVRQAGQTTSLPGEVNTVLDESRPAFDASGRYLGFIHHQSNGLNRLRVWDTTTQEIVSNVGIGQVDPSSEIGAVSRREGSLALFVPSPLISRFSCCATVRFTNLSSTAAGLLVQRIVGTRKLFGRTVPKLKKAGRFPLGKFRKGRHRKRWQFTVGVGKQRRLPPGCYLVTLRALTPKLQVRDLSKPYTVRIRKGKQPLVRRGVRLRTCRAR
jgi:hypothetical protein